MNSSVPASTSTMNLLLQTPDPTIVAQPKVLKKQVKSILKRTPNAWTIFLNGNRVRVQRPLKGQQPLSSTTDVVTVSGKGEVKRLAAVWKSMNDETKKPYQLQSSTKRQENKIRCRTLPESDKALVKRFKTENPRSQTQSSPYMSYVKAQGGAIIKKHGIKEGGKLLGKNWKDMTPEQKNCFSVSSVPVSVPVPVPVPSALATSSGTGAEAEADDESEYSSDLEDGEIGEGSQAV